MNKNVLSGLLFLIIGVLFLAYSFSYPIGTLHDMGPGFFPLVVSIIQISLALYVIVKEFINAR